MRKVEKSAATTCMKANIEKKKFEAVEVQKVEEVFFSEFYYLQLGF